MKINAEGDDMPASTLVTIMTSVYSQPSKLGLCYPTDEEKTQLIHLKKIPSKFSTIISNHSYYAHASNLLSYATFLVLQLILVQRRCRHQLTRLLVLHTGWHQK